MRNSNHRSLMLFVFETVDSCIMLEPITCLPCFKCINFFPRTMRNLYEDSNWSQKNLMGLIHKARESITRSKSNAFSMDALKHYDMELQQRIQEGHSVSFTDLWSLFIDRMFHDEVGFAWTRLTSGGLISFSEQSAFPICENEDRKHLLLHNFSV